jgi:hypothetical protein
MEQLSRKALWAPDSPSTDATYRNLWQVQWPHDEMVKGWEPMIYSNLQDFGADRPQVVVEAREEQRRATILTASCCPERNGCGSLAGDSSSLNDEVVTARDALNRSNLHLSRFKGFVLEPPGWFECGGDAPA